MEIPSQTPLYHAVNKDRYSRKEQFNDIQKLTGCKLIAYIANVHDAAGGIDQVDVLAFGDLLQNLEGQDIDLLIQSPGGDIDIAEKLIYICRSVANKFRVIVAESAKSAATLIALSADSVVMGNTSELGPIDPQIPFVTSSGQVVYRPAQSFLDGLQSIQDDVKKADGQLSPVYFPLLQQLDPALIDSCKKAVKRSKVFAEKWLKYSQCKKNGAKAAEIAQKLCDTERYLSHGTVIDHDEAEKELGLCIEYLPPDNELWQRIWRLYCDFEIDMRRMGFVKIFESDAVSIPFPSPNPSTD